jgi:hypothetical protein
LQIVKVGKGRVRLEFNNMETAENYDLQRHGKIMARLSRTRTRIVEVTAQELIYLIQEEKITNIFPVNMELYIKSHKQ